MRYVFRPKEELFWGVVVAMATVLLLELAGLNPDSVSDWRTWGVALGVGMVRAGAGAALDYLRRSLSQQPAPTPALVDDVMALEPEARRRLIHEIGRREGLVH